MGATTPEQQKSVILRHLVPDLILQNYEAGISRGELKAVGLFVDISGFSTLTDSLMRHGQHGAEVLARIMRRVFGGPSQFIYEQGGFIVGYAGDAFTALFPFTDDPASAAQRAAAAAWQIQQRMRQEPLHATEYGSFPISAKVGLAMGDAFWGILRSKDEKRATYYFQGKAIDESARAEHNAQAGQIVFTPEVYNELRQTFSATPYAQYFIVETLLEALPPGRTVPLRQFSPQALTAFFPPELLYEDFQSEFRQAINLFLSLPELPNEILASFSQSVFDLQERYGGLFTRLDFGDKGCNMLFFWGAPVAYENDLERALNFVLELKSQAPFAFTAGLTYYISRAGFMGSYWMEEYTCYGWGINLAARLMISAPRGEIWLDERVARRAAGFDLSFVGAQNFKGFAQPQNVYRLQGRKLEYAALFKGGYIGREAEMESLRQFVAPLWQGKFAGSLAVIGEPGMGKSRLMYEFERDDFFTDRPVRWALCQSDPLLRESLNPLRYWLRSYFKPPASSTGVENIGSRLQELRAQTLSPDLRRQLEQAQPFLEALLGFQPENPLYHQLDARTRFQNTLAALTALIKAESLRQPLLLFLEDAQYLDEDSLAFLPALYRSLKTEGTYPVALLVSSRREGAALPLPLALSEREINLPGFTPEQMAQFVANSLAQTPAPGLLQLLQQRAEGNPFFAGQILRYLQEENRLIDSAEGLQCAPNSADLLPPDINALLTARLDQLPYHLRRVAQMASVLGREFETPVLAHMLPEDAPLAQTIQQGESAAIWSALTESRYIFQHALLRDAAYNMQMQARRRTLHEQAFRALENLFASQLEKHYGELAYHAEQARLVSQALHYLQQAAAQSVNLYQNRIAAEYYTRALALTDPQDLQTRFTIHLGLEDVFDKLGERVPQKKSLETLSQIADLLQDTQKQTTCARLLTGYLSSLNEFQNAISQAQHTIQLAESQNHPEEEVLALVYILSAYYHLNIFNETVVEYARQGIEKARQLDMKDGEARILNTYGVILQSLGRYEEARSVLQESLRLYRQTENLDGQTRPLSNLGLLAILSGEFAAAKRYYEEALEQGWRIGIQVGQDNALFNLGFTYGAMGNFTRARSLLQQAIKISQETENPHIEAISLLNLGLFAELQGEPLQGLEYAQKAGQIFEQIKDENGLAWGWFCQGRCLAALNHPQAAQSAYQSALEIFTNLRFDIQRVEVLAGMADLALQTRQLPAVQEALTPLLEYLPQNPTLQGSDQPLRVYLTCYHALQALGEEQNALSCLEKAFQLLTDLVKNIDEEALRETYLNGIPYHRALRREAALRGLPALGESSGGWVSQV